MIPKNRLPEDNGRGERRVATLDRPRGITLWGVHFVSNMIDNPRIHARILSTCAVLGVALLAWIALAVADIRTDTRNSLAILSVR